MRIRRSALALAAAACSLSCHSPSLPAPSAWFHTPEIHAVLVNGGGRPSTNFQSHLVHIRGFVGLLEDSGVSPARITVFSGDGADPAADLATRQAHGEDDFWLLPRSAQRALGADIEIIDSTLDGYILQPAKRDALAAWFAGAGRALRGGDTLLFYVTDHGNMNKEDLADNTITLWKEDLSVSQLREMLAQLDPGVRVVMLMSQCFSGSFANAALPPRNVCGYFSSTADRPAYGCYPENRGVDGVGHSHHFLEALSELGAFPEAEDRVLVTDDSPDVPNSSSDFFLEKTLRDAAGDADLSAFADALIARAFTRRARWEPEIRLLDRIAHTFGVFSPRSLAELDEKTAKLPELSDRLRTYAQLWTQALDAAAAANLRAFADTHPAWKKKLIPASVKSLSAAARATRRRKLLAALVPFTRADRERYARMQLLHDRAEKAAAAAYRMEVRLGVLLRLRTTLLDIAGRTYLEEGADADARAGYAALRDCEGFALRAPAGVPRAADLEPPAPFPALADEQRLVEAVMPAWMGIRYRPPTPAEERDPHRSKGAVNVVTVFDGSPAAAAGLRVGDIILGPPGAPFVEPNQVREWTMRREIGEPAPLRLRRGKRIIDVTLHPSAFPLELPSLPGPPKKGSEAPPLHLESFRGDVEPRPGRSTILFFWATWCAPCKASLPQLLAFAAEHDADVIAITDEPREVLVPFFASFSGEFPGDVAVDVNRMAFQDYGVSGTPTFVLIGPDGKIAAYQTGYNAAKGLQLQ
jgi:thiol-disulfide isomerase/thioredoxin